MAFKYFCGKSSSQYDSIAPFLKGGRHSIVDEISMKYP